MAIKGGKTKSKKGATGEQSFDPYGINRLFLERIFKDAVAQQKHLQPDEAMLEYYKIWQEYVEKSGIKSEETLKHVRGNKEDFSRKIHHLAVDIYYDTYFGKKRVGAPPISDEHLKYILSLSEKGLNHTQIARALGYPTTPRSELIKSSDKVRKQLAEAKKRVGNSAR